MTVQVAVACLFGIAGTVCAVLAARAERSMQRHRQPGISYAAATLRRDGGWRRTDLFTATGLVLQARAARRGIAAVICWLLAVASWIALGYVAAR